MYEGKTLAVILSMHRSGSSLVTNLLQRLGMSLGPFELAPANKSNKYGHFEAVPLVHLNRAIQARAVGFADDLPESAALLRQFVEQQGQWKSETILTESDLAPGKELLDRLVQSGPISGFKDPRTVLVWPMWRRVLAGFPGLRVVLVLLTRSPHEIAMSLFMRSTGRWSYRDALDVTAVHFQRMLGIAREWEGERAVVRFAPTVFAADMRQAAEMCGLTWQEGVLAAVYAPECRHHESAVVDHPAQALFAQLATAVDLSANDRRLRDDAALREATLQQSLLVSQEEIVRAQREIAHWCQEAAQFHQEAEESAQRLQQCRQEAAQFHQEAEESAQRLQQCRQEAAQFHQEAEESAQRLQQCRQEAAHFHQEAEESAQCLQQCRQEVAQFHQEADESAQRLQQCLQEAAQFHQEAEESTQHLQQCRQEAAQLYQEVEASARRLQQCREEIERCRQEATRNRTSAEQLTEILGSRGWAFLQSLRRARLAVAPRGSRREAIARQGLRVARRAAVMAHSLSGTRRRKDREQQSESAGDSRDATSGAASGQGQPLHAWPSSLHNAGTAIIQGGITVDKAPYLF